MRNELGLQRKKYQYVDLLEERKSESKWKKPRFTVFLHQLILLFAVLAVASAQRTRPELCKGRVPCRPRPPARRIIRLLPLPRYGFGDDDQYFASLGGADVGRYNREQRTRRGWGGDYQETEVSGVSLGKAKVGLYSRERDGRAPLYG
ncbi:hypothetical protein TNCV_3080331 [Trichonephila clavipes]|nr:hypothetical protein TNCV_3080331 [Trichonephila clavipes]